MLQLKRWMFKLLPYRPDSFSREDFELQYSSGRYDYLRGLSELVHYSVLIGYCHYLKPAGSILDVGCGEGILQERLEPGKYSRYIGIDISHEAIRRASDRQDAKTLFITADVLTYIPPEQFDIIVFNECLYHFDEPLNVLRKYESFLKDDGIFLVSICDHESTSPIWKMLEAVYAPEDAVQVLHRPDLSWTIKVLKPARHD